MSNSPFGSLNTQDLEQAGDVLSGNFGPIDSGVYDGVVLTAYAGKSDGGAHNMTFEVELDVNGKKHQYRETIYVTNKKGEPFYEKDNKKNPLPGFTTANDIALLTTGQELNAQDFEEKVVKIYDYDQRTQVPTKVQMAVDIVGKPITLAIVRRIVDKQAKDNNGNYVPTGETREENVIDKVFHAESGRTVSEVVRKLETGEFKQQWADKNTGVTQNRAKGAAGKPGVPGQASPAPAAAAASKPVDLFGRS